MNEIYKKAELHGACGWGLDAINSASTVADLIKLLKTPKGVEFAMDNDFLPIELLKKHRHLLESENIYFDGVHKVLNPRILVVLGGHVEVEVNSFSCCRIYAKGSVRLFASENAFVMASVHKDGSIYSEVYGQARVREY